MSDYWDNLSAITLVQRSLGMLSPAEGVSDVILTELKLKNLRKIRGDSNLFSLESRTKI